MKFIDEFMTDIEICKFQMERACFLCTNMVLYTCLMCWPLFGPRHDKTCLRIFHQIEAQTNLVSYRD